MADNIIGVFVPSDEERKVMYRDYISRIYAILVNYEAKQTINKEYINLLCFEIQAYGHLTQNEDLAYIVGKLCTLTVDGVEHSYVRKTVLDTTNFLSRLLG